MEVVTNYFPFDWSTAVGSPDDAVHWMMNSYDVEGMEKDAAYVKRNVDANATLTMMPMPAALPASMVYVHAVHSVPSSACLQWKCPLKSCGQFEFEFIQRGSSCFHAEDYRMVVMNPDHEVPDFLKNKKYTSEYSVNVLRTTGSVFEAKEGTVVAQVVRTLTYE